MSSSSNRAPPVESSSTPDRNQDAEAEIEAANRELGQTVGSVLRRPFAMLSAQRDSAIRAAHEARAQAERERAAMLQQEDRFIALLMSEHERELAELRRKLQGACAQPEPSRALGSAEAPLASNPDRSEADQARAELARVRAELDQAIADSNDLRLEYRKQVESAQDEVSRLSWQLDEARRGLEDARDEARDEVHRLSELLAEMRRELDERNEELRRLRACMTELDQQIQSRPPPAAAVELEGARRELDSLRHRFIDVKREQSRLAHELELSRARRRVVISIPASVADEPRRNPSES
jgi:predicted NUDIX family NTP pyrophosphohydrolase